MNLKKILLGAFVVVATAVSLAPANSSAATNDPEFTNGALPWMYENGLTKFNTEDAFMPFATLTREQFAKFAAAFVVTNICLEPNEAASCDFSDLPADPSLDEYVMLACQLGLVKGSAGKYYPTDAVSKAAVLTVMSRALSAAADEDAPAETMTPWWKGHFDAMKSEGITKETDVYAVDRPVTRYEVALMLYRARVEDATCSDTDISDLLEDLFGDITTSGDDTTEDVADTSNGTAKAVLSPATPNGATIPGSVSVKVASYNFTATTEAVTLDEVVLKRLGLGSDDVVDKVTLFVNGEVVSKSKSFNSDDEAVFTISPAVTIQPGQTVRVDVVTKVGDAATASNQEFSVALVDFSTNGAEDKSNLPVNGNTFRVGGVDGANVIIDDDGNVSDVSLGDKGVEVAKFTVENNSTNDVTLTQITLKDDNKNADEDLANFVLKRNGIIVGTAAKTNGKYLTFALSGVAIGDNETEDFKVFADVIAGAGDEISFIIDQEIYVLGTDAKYGYGIAVDTSSYAAQTFAIKAGELTLVEKALPYDLARADRDDVILASFDVIPNAGKDLSLENIKFALMGTNSLGGDTWGDVFENAEVWVTVDGATKRFDLNESNDTATTIDFADTDLGIFLKSGKTTNIQLVADTVTPFPAAWTDGDDSFAVKLTTSTAGGFKVIENGDDKVVESIVPSSITFDTIKLVTSTVAVTKLNLGTNVNVVKGTPNVDAYKFQVKPDKAGDVYAQSFSFDLNVASCAVTPDANLVSALRLWKWDGSASGGSWTLVEQAGGFDLTPAGAITFDDFEEIEILASKTQQFLLTLDVNDDDAVTGCVISPYITAADIEDDQNKDLTVTVPGAVGRTITVTNAGTLSINTELVESTVNRAKHVVAGTTSDYVAAWDFVATNEGVKINDLTITAAGAGAAQFTTSVTELKLFDKDGNELYSEAISANPIVLDNIDLDLPAGTTTLYAKVVTDNIGDGFNGAYMDDVTLAITAIDVEGASSGDPITPTNAMTPSYAFDVIPTHISNVAIQAPGSTVLSNGTNILGTIAITANTWNNVDLDDGADIDLLLAQLGFDVDDTAGVITAISVERMDITSADKVCDAIIGSPNTVDFSTCDAVVAQINAGATALYRVEATVAGAVTNDSVQLRLNDLNGSEITYESTDTNGGDPVIMNGLRLPIGNSIIGTKLVAN